MRMSFSAFTPKSVRSRLENRKRTTSTSSSSSSYTISATSVSDINSANTSSNCGGSSGGGDGNIMGFQPVLQRRPSGLSLYGVYPASTHSSDVDRKEQEEEDEMGEEEKSILEPRPVKTRCAGLFELMDRRVSF